jgi:hypothetical protein
MQIYQMLKLPLDFRKKTVRQDPVFEEKYLWRYQKHDGRCKGMYLLATFTTLTMRSKADLVALILIGWWHIGVVLGGTPAPARYFPDQLVDHFSSYEAATSNNPPLMMRPRTVWTQRYYAFEDHFRGPGSPIFVIMGGESNIEPTTGLLYPFVTNVLAAHFGAYVLQPEHRFYGESQPICPCEIEKAKRRGLPDPREKLLTYEQALYDAARLLRHVQSSLGCSSTIEDRFSPEYCPVIAVGGSYPGFLAAMARIVLPNVFDMAYAASAPMKFYAQQVPSSAYYNHITQVAEQAVQGCANAVRTTLLAVQQKFQTSPTTLDWNLIGTCPGTIPDYITKSSSVETFLEETFMMVAYTFANQNMAYYPPSNDTALVRSCQIFLSDHCPVQKLRTFLVRSLAASKNATCFDMRQQLPSGTNATISGGDWSGVGTGTSGESWDFQTCTLCVEAIGFNSTTSMFPDREWSLAWLTKHCQSRFGVIPQPWTLRKRWHINDLTQTNATRILFTNGMRDGWSVSGITENISDASQLLALNFPNGAHHSDLSGRGPSDDDTEDIQHGFVQIENILASWMGEFPRQGRLIPQLL